MGCPRDAATRSIWRGLQGEIALQRRTHAGRSERTSQRQGVNDTAGLPDLQLVLAPIVCAADQGSR
jgi:hypothetical protein